MEQTLVIIKPVAVHRGLIGEVITRFERKGLFIIGMKMMQLDEQILREHYAHLTSKPFFPDLLKSMMATPVIVMCIEGKDNAKIELARFFKPGEILAYKPSDFQFYYAPDEV